MEKDIEEFAFLFHDYEAIRNNYHFLNSELFEMDRLETKIKNIVAKYDDNLPGLIELANRVPKIIDFISGEKLKVVKEAVAQNQVQSNNQFYSYDGQVFSSMKEAMARNNEITMGTQQNTPSKSL